MDLRERYQWRYTRGGAVTHALVDVSDTRAICGLEVFDATDWHGTGAQVEYELVEQMPMCQRCVAASKRKC